MMPYSLGTRLRHARSRVRHRLARPGSIAGGWSSVTDFRPPRQGRTGRRPDHSGAGVIEKGKRLLKKLRK